MHRVTVM